MDAHHGALPLSFTGTTTGLTTLPLRSWKGAFVMTAYNTKMKTTPRTPGRLKTAPTATGRTHEGAPGYLNDAKTELFLRAAGTFAGQSTMYETAKARDARLVMLSRSIAVTADGMNWLLGFVPWLRTSGFMRTAPVLIASEAVAARLGAGMNGGNRQVIAAAVARSDEPGELVAYWRTHIGTTLPMAVKRGLSDALNRVYSEYALLKYDTASHGYRFGDVIELVRPTAKAPADLMDRMPADRLEEFTSEGVQAYLGSWEARQNDLYRYAIDRRHDRGNPIPSSLKMIAANLDLRWRVTKEGDTTALTDAASLRAAGFTWEDALSLAGKDVDKKALWEAAIPQMGYMALLRNLRNFDQAGVSDKVASKITAKLTDPAQVARSRQLPFRFLTAYREAPSLRWSYPLDQALTASMGNVPKLAGRTLILIDTSSSMSWAVSGRSDVRRWDLSALFGLALARACDHADVWSFSTRAMPWQPVRGESLLKSLERWKQGWFLTGGTETAAAVRATFANHDRVVVVTDDEVARDCMQVTQTVPEKVHLFTFNVVGGTQSSFPTGRYRHLLGGITDSSFGLIPVLEAGANGSWPWEVDSH